MGSISLNEQSPNVLQQESKLFQNTIPELSSELLGKSSTAPLPSDIPRSDLSDRFFDFFSDKSDRIRDDLDSRSCQPLTFAVFDGPQLSQLEPVTDELIRELILKSPTKSCMLDPIPTSLTKQ